MRQLGLSVRDTHDAGRSIHSRVVHCVAIAGDASSLAATEAMAASVEVLASASELRLPPRRDASVVLAYTARAMAGAGTGASVDGAGTSVGLEAPTGEAAETCAQMHSVNAELLRHFWTAMRSTRRVWCCAMQLLPCLTSHCSARCAATSEENSGDAA